MIPDIPPDWLLLVVSLPTPNATARMRIWRSLKAMGNFAEAEALQQALRRELTTIHLRSRMAHPLLGPELAFAFCAE